MSFNTQISSPTLQLGDFPLLSHVSLSGGHVSPVLSPESPLLLPPVSCLFHHKALFLSKLFLLSWGMSPLLLPSSQQPALLCLSLEGQQSFPAFPGPGWSPLASVQGSASSPIIFHKCWWKMVPCLSPSLSSSLIPTVSRDSALAGPGTECEWAEGRHPQAAGGFQSGRDGPQCLGVTRVSFSLAVKV